MQKGIDLVTFSGFRHDNPLRSYGNLAFWVDSNNYNHVETVHQTLLLATIDFVVNSGERPKLIKELAGDHSYIGQCQLKIHTIGILMFSPLITGFLAEIFI